MTDTRYPRLKTLRPNPDDAQASYDACRHFDYRGPTFASVEDFNADALMEIIKHAAPKYRKLVFTVIMPIGDHTFPEVSQVWEIVEYLLNIIAPDLLLITPTWRFSVGDARRDTGLNHHTFYIPLYSTIVEGIDDGEELPDPTEDLGPPPSATYH